MAELAVLNKIPQWKKKRNLLKSCRAERFKSLGEGVWENDDGCSSSIIVVTSKGKGLAIFEITDPKLVGKLLPALT